MEKIDLIWVIIGLIVLVIFFGGSWYFGNKAEHIMHDAGSKFVVIIFFIFSFVLLVFLPPLFGRQFPIDFLGWVNPPKIWDTICDLFPPTGEMDKKITVFELSRIAPIIIFVILASLVMFWGNWKTVIISCVLVVFFVGSAAYALKITPLPGEITRYAASVSADGKPLLDGFGKAVKYTTTKWQSILFVFCATGILLGGLMKFSLKEWKNILSKTFLLILLLILFFSYYIFGINSVLYIIVAFALIGSFLFVKHITKETENNN